MADRIFFDTNPIIYYFDAHPSYARKVYQFLVFNKMNGCDYCTSVITNAEFLCKPLACFDFDKIQEYDRFIQDFGFSVVPITDPIAWRAAQIRVKYKGIKLPDAVQLAAAIEHRCDTFLTNDAQLKQVKEANVLCLDDLA